ncbi:DUF6597 domain-containing transcriptional factor [Capnocytophaga canimorsus]|uniref:DUF6597 domain-containing protein n=1 Tax=Capnocytophaga canimorsus (strain 5) TaxID=860228 RepID=F9YS54_CAPCC|nr:DUF6597 domain-containing transcriptional factor [Capnocytophaga canimorsus]AEK22607.1 Hypothetical protein Ccan_04850 [Capnocytophaga canimorsus Cc5]WGU69359.1 hypothetical protein QIU19_06540 [Capnocytophaga canimorsus]WGU71519.1 hypothetical protein QIU18_07190 [Capnocytophaga canimorsus]
MGKTIFDGAMKYRIIKPNAFLRKYIEHFWEAETDEYFRYFSPPSTLTDLVFFCEGTMRNIQNREELSKIGIIFGQKTVFDNYKAVFPKAKLFGVRVRPSGFNFHSKEVGEKLQPFRAFRKMLI